MFQGHFYPSQVFNSLGNTCGSDLLLHSPDSTSRDTFPVRLVCFWPVCLGNNPACRQWQLALSHARPVGDHCISHLYRSTSEQLSHSRLKAGCVLHLTLYSKQLHAIFFFLTSSRKKKFIGISLFMTIFVVKTFLLQIYVEKVLQMNIALM